MHRMRLLGATCTACLGLATARADNFGRIYYDKHADQLVVTLLYRGTNANHQFSLKWGECRSGESGNSSGVTAVVLDDQFEDAAQRDYKKTVHFSLADMPCPRPASVTLRTAPRFLYTLTIPGH